MLPIVEILATLVILLMPLLLTKLMIPMMLIILGIPVLIPTSQMPRVPKLLMILMLLATQMVPMMPMILTIHMILLIMMKCLLLAQWNTKGITKQKAQDFMSLLSREPQT